MLSPLPLKWRASANPERLSSPAPGKTSVTGSPLAEMAAPAVGVSRTAVRGERQRPEGHASFDPMIVERLTEDVVRRVEKRVRVERERRGL
jgi:hypothetical protein